jgi:hypothetical protein
LKRRGGGIERIFSENFRKTLQLEGMILKKGGKFFEALFSMPFF